jgi:hypothetical protein
LIVRGGDHFLLGERLSVKEDLHWRFAKAPSPPAGLLLVAGLNPAAKAGRYAVDQRLIGEFRPSNIGHSRSALAT